MDIRTIEMRIARGENLPVLPQVVTAIFRIADDPSCTARDLELLIEEDPALTAKILRVVNSPLYSVGSVKTVGRALGVLGTNRVRALITSIALQHLVNDRQEATQFNKLEYWRHSLAVAIAAREISKQKIPTQMEEMFVAGILHDIGLLLMDKFCPDSLDAVIRTAESQAVRLSDIEPELLDFGHADLGGIMARKWGLGEFLATAVEKHHDSEGYSTDSPAEILALADAIAHATGFTNQLPSVQYEISSEELESMGLPSDMVAEMKDLLCHEVEKTEKNLAFDAPPPKPTAQASDDRVVRSARLSAAGRHG